MSLRYKDISEIIGLIDASSCDEFVLETDEVKLVLRRRGAGAAPPFGGSAAGPVQSTSLPPAAPSAPKHPTATAIAATQGQSAQDGAGVVSAPMVGTFYRAPSPSEPPFVEVGSKVAPGDPLGIIEVMKLFTTIHAEAGGIVKEIGAENAQLVEYGQMLFVIAPD